MGNVIETLQDFYGVMNATRDARRVLTESVLHEESISSHQCDVLKSALDRLQSLPKTDNGYSICLAGDRYITIDVSYEVEELKKDIYYLSHSEESFYVYLSELNKSFSDDLKTVLNALKNKSFTVMATDRDGTVNNYCARYISSIQSVYNAVFLSRFAEKCLQNAIILTSAPLSNIGMTDVSVAPPGRFIYAGSKGREYLDRNGKPGTYPVEPEKQKKLDELNTRLMELIKQPAYEKFGLIGSALQKKFGQTTIARQDINGSISEDESQAWFDVIKKTVHEVDSEGIYFRLEDTGYDIEIILTIESDTDGKLKDFDKGDGILFLNEKLGLSMEKGTNLICGDTSSDVPMVSASVSVNTDTCTVFVTDKQELRERVRAVCPSAYFVSSPDTLVSLFNSISKREKV